MIARVHLRNLRREAEAMEKNIASMEAQAHWYQLEAALTTGLLQAKMEEIAEYEEEMKTIEGTTNSTD